jgi:hypothetical protein
MVFAFLPVYAAAEDPVPFADKPNGFTATAKAGGTVELNWSPPDYASALAIIRYEYTTHGYSGPWTEIPGGANAATYTVSGLNSGTSYDFSVRAVNPAGNGNLTTPISVTPDGIAPTVVSISPSGVDVAPNTNKIYITFSEPMEPSTHSGYVSVDNGGEIQIDTMNWSSDTTVDFKLGGLTYGKQYTVTVYGSGYRDVAGNAMGTNWSGSFSTKSDPARRLVSAETYGGVDGKTTTTGILLTFDKAVSGLTANDLYISGGRGDPTKGAVTEVSGGSGTQWIVNITQFVPGGGGAWYNGDLLAIYVEVRNFGEYTFTYEASVRPLSGRVYKPVPENKPNIGIDYVNKKLTGFTANQLYTINNVEYTPLGASLDIDSAWFGNSLAIVKKEGTASVDSTAQSLSIPSLPTPPSIAGGAGTITLTGESPLQYATSASGPWTDYGADLGDARYGLTVGSYYARTGPTASTFVSETAGPVTVTAGTYTLTLGAPSFTAITQGDGQPAAQALTITKTGNQPTATIKSVAVSGSDFILNQTTGGSVTDTANTTYTIQPKAGLTAGTHQETVTVTYYTDAANSLTATVTANVSINVKDNVTYTVAQVGGADGTADTTGILITFNKDIAGEFAGAVTLNNGVTQASAITNNGDANTGTWFLPINVPANKTNVVVTVANWGNYTVTPTPSK